MTIMFVSMGIAISLCEMLLHRTTALRGKQAKFFLREIYPLTMLKITFVSTEIAMK